MSIVGSELLGYFFSGDSEGWRQHARCRETGPDDQTWFPEKGPRQDAKKICASCDVKAECLAYALAKPEPAGVWGGMTFEERKRIRRGLSPIPPRPQGHTDSCYCPRCNRAKRSA